MPHFDAYLKLQNGNLRLIICCRMPPARHHGKPSPQFDSAASRLRMLADRRFGEAHPLDVAHHRGGALLQN